MRVEASEEALTLLYSRARESYVRCISSKENEFLQAQVDMPLEAITVRNMAVRIILHQHFVANYQVEAELGLYANGNYTGRYTYCEDEMGNAVEDGLFFF